MKHTPGPWTYDKASGAVIYNENVMIGRVFQDKNGPLIAAAPEILEALQLVQPFCILRGSANVDEEQWRNVMDAVERAIAKAKD